MFRRLMPRRRLPSPALAVATLALILAIGGGAYAAGGSDKKSDKKIAKAVVHQLAGGLSVNHAATATHAGTADSATVGGPVAFATVAATGAVAPAHSRGIASANVTDAGISSYCLKNLPAFTFALASTGYASNGSPYNAPSTATIGYPDFPGPATFASDCPGAQLEVTTTTSNGFQRQPFYIALFK